MTSLIEQHRAELEALCRRYHVARLDVFGSAAGDRFDPARSDLDFLVEFQPGAQSDAADHYFGLLFALQELFGKPIDLVCAGAMRNPYFIRAVNRTRKLLYAA